MKKTILVYGILGGLLIATLKVIEYRFLVVEHSLEIYGGLVALLFSALGIWLGLKLTRTHERVVVREVSVVVREVPVDRQVSVAVPTATGPFQRDDARVAQLGITPRELDILDAMAEGLSNREIAERLFVSENTVKTRAGRARCAWSPRGASRRCMRHWATSTTRLRGWRLRSWKRRRA